MNDRTVAEVLTDPAFRDAAVPNQLAEVMRRSKGAANPHNVQLELVARLRLRCQVAEEDNADLREKAADAKAIAVDAVADLVEMRRVASNATLRADVALAELVRARKHACASCVREFDALEAAGLDPSRSYSEQVRELLAAADAFLNWEPPHEKAWRNPYELAEARVKLEEIVKRRRSTSARRDE